MTELSLPRRKLLIGAGGAAAAIALGGCAPGLGSKSSSPRKSDSKTITLMNWEARKGSAYDEVLAAFEEATGYKVEYQFPAGPGQDWWPKARTVLGSSNPPDLMRIDDGTLGVYAKTGRLLDLKKFFDKSGLAESDYYSTVLHSTRQADGTYPAWSLGSQPRVLYYNKTVFQEAGVPLPPSTWTSENWTWENFLESAKKLTVPGKRFGACIVYDRGSDIIWPINNGGVGRFSAEGPRFGLSGTKDAAAIQWLADLSCVHGVQPAWSKLRQNNVGQQMFASGQVAMFEHVTAFVSFFRKNVSGFEWDIAPMPGREAQKTYSSQVDFGIPSAAANPEGAWALLQFMTTMDGAKFFAQGAAMVPGYIPATKLMVSEGKNPASVDVIRGAVENSVGEVEVNNGEAAKDIYRRALDQVWNCQATAADALKGVEAQVNSTISGS